jgi:hypothetical protein
MTRARSVLTLVVLAVLTWTPAATGQPVICNQVGNTVVCSNGQVFTSVGNVTIDNSGGVQTSVGGQTLGSQGSLYTQQGNHVFDNRGNSWNVIDDQLVGPTGQKCSRVGEQVLCR